MNWLRAVWLESIGLFVDDAGFATAILVWLMLCWLVLPRLGLVSILPPVILFAGLVVILARSALAGAKRQR